MARPTFSILLPLALVAAGCSADATTESTRQPSTTQVPPTTAPTLTTTTEAEPAATEPATPILFEQSVDPSIATEARTSQMATEVETFAFTHDDFTLPDGGTIAAIEWDGIYCEKRVGAPSPDPSVSDFVIEIYPDDGSAMPDAANPLLSEIHPTSDLSETKTASRDDLNCGDVGPTTWDFYHYRVELETPFVADPGVRYWLSIQAVTPDFTPFWGWSGAIGGDGRSMMLFQGEWQVFNLDRAFVLLRQGT